MQKLRDLPAKVFHLLNTNPGMLPRMIRSWYAFQPELKGTVTRMR